MGSKEIVCKLIELDDSKAWGLALEGFRLCPGHSYTFNRAVRKSDNLQRYLFLASSRTGKFLLPFAERTWRGNIDVTTPYGIAGPTAIGDVTDLKLRWSEFAKTQGYVCAYIGLNPILESALQYNSAEITTSNTISILDLKNGFETVQSRFSKNMRERLIALKKNQLEVITDKKRILAAISDLYPSTMDRVGARSIYRFNQSTLCELITDTNSLAVAVLRKNIIEAASIFCTSGLMADYTLNASSLFGRSFGALLIESAIKILCSRNISYLNLGGGIIEEDGLATFKRRFGGIEYPLKSVQQVYDETTYLNLCRLAVNKSASTYFPAYREGQNTR